jgi:acyl-CoA oxidase
LRGAETTATYDEQHDEFIIHSPTLTATKVWIGMAGETATHTVALCNTIVQGKACGLNWFIVPMRHPDTGHTLPGVTCGDMGAKAGRHGLDNGWIQFTHVRVPHKYMLSKWASVSTSGVFTSSPNASLAYAALIYERLASVSMVAYIGAQATTIAVRYSCVRRQGAQDQQIMDYQSQYLRIMPAVASSYVLTIGFQVLDAYWKELMGYLEDDVPRFLSLLPDIHGISAGAKAVMTWWGSEVLERCRRACGGHAYSAYNFISTMIDEWGVMTTGGGDNVVLLQQSARYLFGSLQKVWSGQTVTGSVAYLNQAATLVNTPPGNVEQHLTTLKGLMHLYTLLCVRRLVSAAKQLAQPAESMEQAWNDNMDGSLTAARLHAHRYFMDVYINEIQRRLDNKLIDGSVHAALEACGRVWFLHCIVDELAHFLEDGLLDSNQTKSIRTHYTQACKTLRKDAVALVDAFGYPDFVLKAPIGRYNGDIYTGKILCGDVYV